MFSGQVRLFWGSRFGVFMLLITCYSILDGALFEYHIIKSVAIVIRMATGMASRFLVFGIWRILLYVPQHISLETFPNCTEKVLTLYGQIDHFEPESEARVSIWYGAKEPNMKK